MPTYVTLENSRVVVETLAKWWKHSALVCENDAEDDTPKHSKNDKDKVRRRRLDPTVMQMRKNELQVEFQVQNRDLTQKSVHMWNQSLTS